MNNYHNFHPQNPNQDFQEIRRLWNKWDPIGVLPDKNDCLDEYDSYLEATLLLLNEDAPISEIEDYLFFVTGEMIGLDSKHIESCQPHEFATKLKTWFVYRKLEKKLIT